MFMRVNAKCAHQVRPPSEVDKDEHDPQILGDF
jgi:hypothetical protein